MSNVIHCKAVSKTYDSGVGKVSPLKNVDFALAQGEMAAIVGASGSGKTTLLNVMAGLDRPDGGEVSIVGEVINTLSDNKLAELRNKHVGFVFQFHHLLPEFSALENILMPIRIGRKVTRADRENALSLLAKVGLAERAGHKPSELSGGERQRVAIARALIHTPKLVFMDEPTGNLDEETSEQIHQLLLNLNQTESASFVVVTHSKELARRFARVFQMTNGSLVEEHDF